jgi:GxxExxY protein
MLHAELTARVIETFHHLHKHLRHGYPEVYYQRGLAVGLDLRNIPYAREVSTPVMYCGYCLGHLRLDLVVDERVVVECKVAPKLTVAHRNQLLGYLQATQYEVGLLLNFGPVPEFKRVVHTRG